MRDELTMPDSNSYISPVGRWSPPVAAVVGTGGESITKLRNRIWDDLPQGGTAFLGFNLKGKIAFTRMVQPDFRTVFRLDPRPPAGPPGFYKIGFEHLTGPLWLPNPGPTGPTGRSGPGLKTLNGTPAVVIFSPAHVELHSKLQSSGSSPPLHF
ncbi:hypothetical protein R6Q59_033431 [Mikania micrantha]